MSDKPLEQSIFLTALELATPAEREAYLHGACGNNEALRAAVAELLAAHERAGNILDAPPVAAGVTVAQDNFGARSLEQPGTVIGPYKLSEPIGEGGMGAVWMAQQTEPVKRLVALKLIKPGMDSKQVLARFDAERQALALMEHPNIARVLDAGTTDTGRPFFVMELVKGVPITRYCDEHRLTLRQQLELFVPVCQAVQHAHQKGVIHRDLKPSNVLVAAYDGKPVPKVIDFGIAKAAGQTLTDRTLVTGFGAVVGTLEYMSPEQAELNQLDIDTRSDVYALGVLLYELLTGTTPLEKERLRARALLEVLRLIREEEPPAPSLRLSTAAALPAVAASRGLELRRLSRLVRGELDWIVMKSLEKDRNRRYESASALAADVQRYLADEPVLACPPSTAYRLRKFVRRNKVALATLAAVALAVLVAAGSLGWTLNERRERKRRNADEIVRAVDEGRKLQAQRRWPEALALARHAKNVLDHTDGQEALRPRVEELINDLEMIRRLEEIELRKADAGSGFGYARPAAEYHPAFRDYGIDVFGPDADAVAAAIRNRQIADYLIESLDSWARDEQDPATRTRLRTVIQKADPEGILAQWRAAQDLGNQGEMRRFIAGLEVGRVPPATLAILGESMFRGGLRKEAIEWLRAAHSQHPDDFWINQNLAGVYVRTDPPQWDEALRHYTAALALRPQSHMIYSNIGVTLIQLGKRDAALAAAKKALELRPDYAPAHSNIGQMFMDEGKYEQAERALRQAIASDPGYAMAHRNLGCVYAQTKRTKEAFASLDQAIKLNPKFSLAYSTRGTTWAKVKEFDKAIADFQLSLKHDNKNDEAYRGLGWVYEQKQQYADAVKWYETALRHAPHEVDNHYRLGVTYREWGRHEATTGSPKLAMEKFDLAIGKLNDTIRRNEKYAEAWYSLGNALRDRGQIRAAITAFEKAAALMPASDDANYQPHINLGNVHVRLGECSKAIEAYRAAIRANHGCANAYTGLAAALVQQGDFAEAEKVATDALTRVKNPDNIHNYAVVLGRQGRYADALAFVQQCLEKFEGTAEDRARAKQLIGLYEQFLRLQKQLPAILRGEKPPPAADLHNLGEVCIATKDYAAAARFYRDAFAKDPEMAESLEAGYRFDAARAAACAGCGLDKAAALTPAEQAKWRKQAQDWLRADLKLWSQNIEKGGPISAPDSLRALQHWRHHLHLAGVRGAAIEKLEPDERDDWRKFWAEVYTAVKRHQQPGHGERLDRR
jgi:serine/threonine protein kinase/Tfp pilus assembly protein PilF